MLAIDRKLKNNRKLLRQIDLDITKYTLLTVIGQFIIFIVLLVPGGMYSDNTHLSVVIGVILLLFLTQHGFFFLKFDNMYGRGPNRWRKFYTALYVAYLIFWNIFVVYVIKQYGLGVNSFILVTFALGSVVLISLSWAPYLKMNRFITIVSLLPLVMALLFMNTAQASILGFLFLGFSAVLMQQVESVHVRYWDRIETENQLELKTRDLQHAIAEAQMASAVKIDFLGNLTHEIRTPMNSILGMISLMGDTKLNKNQIDMLSVAHQSGDNLLSLIDDILDFSKITSGSIVLDSAVFNLRQCIEEVVEPLGPIAHEKNVEISMVFDQDMPLRVRGDPQRIGQIAQNLIMNAIKFSDEGEIVVAVHLTRLSNLQGLMRIHVSDEGEGISQDQQAKLFDAFYRSENSQSKSSGGTGLGLAICKGLVERMEGQIGLISELGKGSTFWFTVPVRLSTQQKQSSTVKQKFANRKVLLVNATSGMKQSLTNDLTMWDVHVESIQGTDKALQVLRTSQREECGFDIVIINFTFHYSGIFKFSRTIAEDPILKDTKQMIITTIESCGTEKAIAHQARIDNLVYLSKPISRHGLVDGLTELFEEGGKTRMTNIFPIMDSDQSKAIKVLLVEDNKVNQMVAKGMLKQLGYVVKVVEHGQAALSILQDKKFDIILMDCQMPVLDGYETTKCIRDIELNQSVARTPIVAMTAYAMESEITKCLACGMDDFLAKPVNKDELDAKVKMWIEESEATSDEGVIRVSSNNNQSLDDPDAVPLPQDDSSSK